MATVTASAPVFAPPGAPPPPLASPWAEGYWAGLQQGRLVVQCCSACGRLRHYPRPMCPACHSLDHHWLPLSGAGTLHSWTRLHQSGLGASGLAEVHSALPWTLLTVDMAEGVRLLGLLLPAEAASSASSAASSSASASALASTSTSTSTSASASASAPATTLQAGLPVQASVAMGVTGVLQPVFRLA